MTDNDQTFVMPRQRSTPGGTVDDRDFDDSTVVVPERVLIETANQARQNQWDADRPAARGVSPLEGSPHGREKALGTLAWVAAAVVTGAVALIRLNWASMRAGELSAWGFTRAPKAAVFDLLDEVGAADAPYFVLLKGWASVFGRTDFALRMPSAIAMAAAAALVAILGNRLGGPRVGVLSGLLVAVLPVTSRYAQEAGPQALTLFGAALATLALVMYLDRPKAWQLAGYALAVALTGVSHATGLLLVLVHGFVVVAMKREVLLGWLLATLAGAAPAVVLMVLFGAPLRDGDPGAWPSVTGLARDAFGSVLAGGVVLGLGLLALSGRKPGVLYSAWALIPLALLFPLVRLTTYGADQITIVAVAGWAGLAAFTLSRGLIVRGLTAVVVVALAGLPEQIAIRQQDGHGQASHELANVLFTQGKPGDAIVYGPVAGDGQAGRDIVERYLSQAHRPKDVLMKTVARDNGTLRTTECPDVDACLGAAPRVWLVRVGTLDSPLTGLEAGKDGALRVRYTLTQSWNLTGVTLALFTLKPAA
ncbi:glycosyltransferase family 39 protein [Dactylosporangium sp. NPDC000521]|uniref:glycosyltransferase family 39 protein n=1 Tax=Dactylosporangium sp. NPDC000521 TaxID=3363975 RepID=UPI00367BA9A7